jgi:PAS domain-containing protein
MKKGAFTCGLDAALHPVLDEDGEIIEFVGTAVDVTERKHAELERRRLAALVEQAADLMAIIDLSARSTHEPW